MLMIKKLLKRGCENKVESVGVVADNDAADPRYLGKREHLSRGRHGQSVSVFMHLDAMLHTSAA